MGSRIGWILAGVIVAGLIVLGAVIVLFPAHSEPMESAKAGQLELHAVNQSVTAVLDAEPTGAGNAGDDYRKAVELCNANADLLADAQDAVAQGKSPSSEAMAVLRKIDEHCAAAAGRSGMDYSIKYGPPKPEIVYYHPMAGELNSVRGALYTYAAYQNLIDKKPADAARTVKHWFALGWHMTNERVYVSVVRAGLESQFQACAELAGLYRAQKGDLARKAAAVDRYKQAVDEVRGFYDQKYYYLCSTNPNPGDVFNVVQNDKDPAWRLQGIIGLGVVKFTCEKRADLKYANRLLEKVLASGTGLEKATAAAARDLTREEFQLIGTKYLQ